MQDGGQPQLARELAFVARDVELASMVSEQAKLELEQTVGPLPTGPIEIPPSRVGNSDGDGGCAHCSTDGSRGAGSLALGLLGLLALIRRRRIERSRSA
jgi:MYXO-CTERM domain-containing protein